MKRRTFLFVTKEFVDNKQKGIEEFIQKISDELTLRASIKTQFLG